jgi:hypothetical protein
MSSRLAAFWEEFWKSFTWIDQVLDKREKIQTVIWNLLAIFCFVTGITVRFTDIAEFVRPAAPWLIGAFAMYIAWKAGIAWHKTSGPNIWIGDLDLIEVKSPGNKKYVRCDIRVRNTGIGEAVASVHQVDVRDKNGKQINGTKTDAAIPWLQVEPMLIFGERTAFTPVFQIMRQNQKTILSLVAGGWIVLEDQGELWLTIRVDFYKGPNGEFIVSNRRTFHIAFDPTLPEWIRVD